MDFISALNFSPEFQKIFESAVSSTSEGISIADMRQADTPLVFVNKGFCKMTGYEPTDVLGRNCRFLQGENTCEEALRTIRQTMAAQQELTVRLINYRKDGSAFWNRLSLVPVFSIEGELTHYVGIQSDVTRLVWSEHQAIQLQSMKTTIRGVSGLVFNYMFFLKHFREELETVSGAQKDLFDEYDRRWKHVHLELDRLCNAKTLSEFEIDNLEFGKGILS